MFNVEILGILGGHAERWEPDVGACSHLLQCIGLRVEGSGDFINLQPLKRRSTTNYAPFALDREPGSLTDILRPSLSW